MTEKNKSIYSALIANILIAITKFIAGGFTHSASMVSEGIHSLVDTINQLLLLYGLKRSHRAPDEKRPFGYGKELYFWSFIVSILIFGLGGSLSIYQGFLHMQNPQRLENPLINYGVLILSMLFEGASLLIAIKEFRKVKGEDSWWDAIVKSKDPSSFLVLFEDGAAVLGLLIVLVLMLTNQYFNLPFLDGLASVLVGLVLIFVSLILARESRSLLMGEGIAPATQDKIKLLIEKDDRVEKVIGILSTYQAPAEVMLVIIVAFNQHLSTADINNAIPELRNDVKEKFNFVRYIIIQPEDVTHKVLSSM
jgi:cation diffusion facilitator family transporter